MIDNIDRMLNKKFNIYSYIQKSLQTYKICRTFQWKPMDFRPKYDHNCNCTNLEHIYVHINKNGTDGNQP